ncbi:MAG: hypothetical protein M3Q75_14535 [Gemmatimonadota bacterium]|nr:hypothetical protein [Gemmatimonadota bacterium]
MYDLDAYEAGLDTARCQHPEDIPDHLRHDLQHQVRPVPPTRRAPTMTTNHALILLARATEEMDIALIERTAETILAALDSPEGEAPSGMTQREARRIASAARNFALAAREAFESYPEHIVN